MNVLIVSPSAILRSTIREILEQTPGVDAVMELGSALRLNAAMESYAPHLVVWDENLGTDLYMIQNMPGWGSRFQLLVMFNQSPGSQGFDPDEIGRPGRINRMPKPDYAMTGSVELLLTYRPEFSRIMDSIAAQKAYASEPAVLPPVALVVLGASTGGPAAVRTVLSGLPAGFPCGIALVQHIDDGYDAGYAQWLDEHCGLRVRLARDGDRIQSGEVLVAPVNFHLICDKDSFRLDDGPKVLSQRPSVDRLFSSAARNYGPALLGVLLTGIGSDGAHGCLDIVKAGGKTIAQDEASSTVYGMPRAAAELSAASFILDIARIAPALLEMVEGRRRQ